MGKALENRIRQLRQAAETILYKKKWVSLLDVFMAINVVDPAHVPLWRRGRINCLEEAFQGNLHRINQLHREFQAWGKKKGLNQSFTAYVSSTRDRHPLRFSRSGDPNLERAYATHFVSLELSEKKQRKIIEKEQEPGELLVYIVLKGTSCSQCGEVIPAGGLLFLEGDKHLCLGCAKMDHLVFLPAGDAALSRRAKKLSSLIAIVLRFSRSRKRYERQGILVTEEALDEAQRQGDKNGHLREKDR